LATEVPTMYPNRHIGEGEEKGFNH